MANPQDGTQLGTGEVISDEFVDANAGVRRDAQLPATPYKVPRSKIAVGPYGQDWGDASTDQPLAVESRQERQFMELQAVRERSHASLLLQKYAAETVSFVDARGHAMSTRGVR